MYCAPARIASSVARAATSQSRVSPSPTSITLWPLSRNNSRYARSWASPLRWSKAAKALSPLGRVPSRRATASSSWVRCSHATKSPRSEGEKRSCPAVRCTPGLCPETCDKEGHPIGRIATGIHLVSAGLSRFSALIVPRPPGGAWWHIACTSLFIKGTSFDEYSAAYHSLCGRRPVGVGAPHGLPHHPGLRSPHGRQRRGSLPPGEGVEAAGRDHGPLHAAAGRPGRARAHQGSAARHRRDPHQRSGKRARSRQRIGTGG